ncbi:hypothetical protein OB905_06275 [Halobacteria archaeon AArc-dxtr1]|nr:hypothetical protein [Halobacteria archaeon AArc-dxtr1]
MCVKVSDSTGYGPNRGMSTIGYVIAAIIFIGLLPLLPFAAVGYVLYRLLTDDDAEPRRRSWRRNVGGPTHKR